jgi:serine O-acetyltransferase
MNTFDCFYTRALPEIFHLEHPLGSVLGDALYSDYFVCHQSVTVGGDTGCNYPKMDQGVVMYAHSLAIGPCELGYNSSVGANAMIYGGVLERDTVLKCQQGSIIKTANRISNIDTFFCEK